MAVIWGSLAALFIGFADLALIRVSGKASIVTIMVLVSAGGVLVSGLAMALIPSQIQVADLGLGALAGIAMGGALALYVVSMRATTVSVTSPIVAVLSALYPFLYGLIVKGESASTLALIGVAVGLVSLVVTTWSPESVGKLLRGVVLALLAGTSYGVGSILLGETTELSGMWPAATHRLTGVVMFLVTATLLGVPRVPAAGLRAASFLAGMLGTGGLVAFLIGVQTGSLSIVAVTTGMFPAVSVGLLHLFAGHPLRWWQAIGIAGAIGGVALIAVG